MESAWCRSKMACDFRSDVQDHVKSRDSLQRTMQSYWGRTLCEAHWSKAWFHISVARGEVSAKHAELVHEEVRRRTAESRPRHGLAADQRPTHKGLRHPAHPEPRDACPW